MIYKELSLLHFYGGGSVSNRGWAAFFYCILFFSPDYQFTFSVFYPLIPTKQALKHEKMIHFHFYISRNIFTQLSLSVLLACIFHTNASSQEAAPFIFTPTNASGLFYGQVLVNGLSASEDDWIAAFDAEGNCAGASQLIMSSGIAYINLAIYGDDPTTTNIDEGIGGTENFQLRLYLAEAEKYVNFRQADTISWFGNWTNANGTPIPAYSDFTLTYEFVAATHSGFDTVCINTAPFELSGGMPTDGMYAGQGVDDNMYKPGVAGTGTHAIYYIYTGNDGTRDTAATEITVNNLPTVSIPVYDAVCLNSGSINLTGGTPLGGSYTGTGVENDIFSPQSAGIGNHLISYTYADQYGCTNIATSTIAVSNKPQAAFTFDINDLTLNFTSTSIDAVQYDWSFGDGAGSSASNPSHTYSESGTYEVGLVITNLCGADTVVESIAVIATNIEAEFKHYSISIYPNPNKGGFWLKGSLRSVGEVDLRITNLIGRTVYRTQLTLGSKFEQFFHLSSLSNGVYLLHLQE